MPLYPIPAHLLLHSATLRREEPADPWSAPAVTTVSLRRVRIVGSDDMAYSLDGVELRCSRKLYFDCRNSKPSNLEFRLEDAILFQEAGASKTYTVKVIKPVYGDLGNGLHHWEIGLV